MKSVTWLLLGVGLGFVLAHEVASTPRGRAVFDAVDAKCREFTAAVAEGYRSRDEELRGAVDADR